MSDLRQHWKKLEYLKTNNRGKHIHRFQCLICHRTFQNHNNANTHVINCLKLHEQQQPQTQFSMFGIGQSSSIHEEPPNQDDQQDEEPISCQMSDKDIALVELIAECNLSYTQLNSPPWVNFISKLCPSYTIPTNEALRQMIIKHASDSLLEGLHEIRHQVCGLAVDGATLAAKHRYAFILVNPQGLRLAAIKKVDAQDAKSLCKVIAEVLNSCKEIPIAISGIVSDNARALVKALTNTIDDEEITLLALVGNEFIRCACSAHTAQLVIGDLINSSTLEAFYHDVVNLISWLKENRSLFIEKCPTKIPSYISTRWNTLYGCASYLMDHQTLINEFIPYVVQIQNDDYQSKMQKYQNGTLKACPQEPLPPPVQYVPNEWNQYTDALEVIADFTQEVEKDLCLQQHVFVAVNRVYQRLEQLDTPVALEMSALFHERFTSTADISLGKLAYYLTPNGVLEYRAFPPSERSNLLKELKETFIRLYSTFPVTVTRFFPAIFRFYLDSIKIDPGDSPFYVFDELQREEHHISGINEEKPVRFHNFAIVCKCIVSLPATEAMCERCFSQLKSITNQFKKSMKDDLFTSLATLKLCARYKRKYYFCDLETNETDEIFE